MFDFFNFIAAEYPLLSAVGVFLLGTAIGSFLNVCIYRIPEGLSVVRPRSRCCSCGIAIAFYDNIPVISWILLRGRCRNCKTKISSRYLLIELLTGALFVSSWCMLSGWAIFAGFVFVSFLIGVTFVDFDHMIIPDCFTIGGLAVGLILSFFIPEIHNYISVDPYFVKGMQSIISGLIGAFVGSGLLLWITIVAEYFLDKEAMGFGDIKFLGCVGAFCGWEGAVFTIFIGAILGTLFIVPVMLLSKMGFKAGNHFSRLTKEPWTKAPFESESNEAMEVDREEKENILSNQTDNSEVISTANLRIPFGPWLAIAAMLYFVYFRADVTAYFNLVKDIIFTPIFS